MNKELLDLLEKINAKKDEVKNLANEGKLEEAKKAKDELKELQDKFDILKDLDDGAAVPESKVRRNTKRFYSRVCTGCKKWIPCEEFHE